MIHDLQTGIQYNLFFKPEDLPKELLIMLIVQSGTYIKCGQGGDSDHTQGLAARTRMALDALCFTLLLALSLGL